MENLKWNKKTVKLWIGLREELDFFKSSYRNMEKKLSF